MKVKHSKLPEKEQSAVKGFSPKTAKQKEFVELIEDNEIVVAKGVAGSGKSFVALATALNLLGPVYKKLILVKSVTPIPGEEIGFTKGSTKDKMAPVMMSYTWNIDKMLGRRGAADDLINKGLIEVIPLAFFRGLSIDSAVVIIDELQNISFDVFKTIITRIGDDCKYIFLGDTEQIDMRKKEKSCLQTVIDVFKDTDLIQTLEFLDSDCVRNPKIPKILEILRENNI
jgi:phosphate starvation-inducible PhoH-like protein